MLWNCGAGEDFWGSLGQQGNQTSQSERKSVLNIHWKDWLKLGLQYFGQLIWEADSLEKTLMLGKIKGSREGGDRAWDDWMASLPQWTWIWANSGRQWRAGNLGVLQSMGVQRVGHLLSDWTTTAKYFSEAYLFLKCRGHWTITHSQIQKNPRFI